MTNQSEIERAKAMAEMLGMCRVLSDTDDELSDVYSFGDASACYMNGYKLIEISKIITANYTPNETVERKEAEARIDELNKVQDQLFKGNELFRYSRKRITELTKDKGAV